MTLKGDTIAAIATAPGRGGVAIVRVSGPDAFAVAKALTGRSPTPGRIAVSKLYHSTIPHSSRLAPRSLIDEAVVIAFKGPHSYTGEDVVEFQCHGGRVTPRRVLEACFASGARLAERGEFTARAFLNGRLPLEAAEGVIDLVDAKTDRAADAALGRLTGTQRARDRKLYDRALEISTDVEHTLDIDEGELPEGYVEELRAKVEDLRKAIADARTRAREGKILREGAHVVLAGAPNAGKSSLLNALLGESRAIVSDVPGTTRDSIEEWIDLNGWPVILTDTAGIRDADDAIEAEGVRRAEALIAKADVVLALDCEIAGAIRVRAKCDLGRKGGGGLAVSAKTGEGLEDLKAAIVARLEEKAQRMDGCACEDEREIALLTEAHEALEDTDDLVLLANGIRRCAEGLGRLVGAVYSDDLLDGIFSRFCVGK